MCGRKRRHFAGVRQLSMRMLVPNLRSGWLLSQKPQEGVHPGPEQSPLRASERPLSVHRLAKVPTVALLVAAAVPLGIVVAVSATSATVLAASVALAVGAGLGLTVRRPGAQPAVSAEGAACAETASISMALDLAAVVIRSPDGTIRYWSKGAERLFGYTAAEAIGRLSHELLRTRFTQGGRRAALAELMQAGSWQGELRHRRRDGSVVTVAASWELRPEAGRAEPLVVEASTEATALKAAEEELRASEGRLRLAQEVAEIGTWEWHPDTDEQDWSREQHALFGTDPDAEAHPTTERLIALVHRADQPALRAAMARAVETGEYEAEFRIQRRGRDGTEETRWLIGRGRRMPGRAGQRGAMLGMHVDITARKQAEMRQTLLIREVDHRAKNALAVVQAVLRLTRAPDQASFVSAVEGRVAALARAQTLLTESRWSGADLRMLLEGELSPFLAADTLGPCVALNGPPVMLAPVTTQPLSMTVHELATNAMKHGALSVAGGHVDVTWTVPQDGPRRLVLNWEETGGPAVPGAPSRLGFGSRVLRTTVQEQLRGRLSQEWLSSGLRCSMEIPLPDTDPWAGAVEEAS